MRNSSRTTSQTWGRNVRAGPVTFPRSVEGACWRDFSGSTTLRYHRRYAVTSPHDGGSSSLFARKIIELLGKCKHSEVTHAQALGGQYHWLSMARNLFVR